MKYLLVVLVLVISTTTMAQFKFYPHLGANYTDVRVTRTTGIEETKGGFGWQAGVGTDYHTTFGYFLYLGAALRRETYERDSLSHYFQDTVYEYHYNPLFLSLPFGIGYQFPLGKNLSLKVYGGLNVQVGIAGTVTKNVLFYSFDSATNSSTLTREESSSHNIKYGKTSKKQYAYDLANSNWGVNIGAGLNFLNSAEVQVSYHRGWTNFLPNRDQAAEINKLSFIELNVRLYFPNPYLNERKKK